MNQSINIGVKQDETIGVQRSTLIGTTDSLKVGAAARHSSGERIPSQLVDQSARHRVRR